MARRGENIYKRKDGRWEGRYRNGCKLDGTAKYSSVYGKSYLEVRSALAIKRSSIRSESIICRLTFGELALLWLDNVRSAVKESTYANYRMKIEKHILTALGEIQYERLTVNILNEFVRKKLSDGLSAKYVSDIAVLIKSISKFSHRCYGYADKAEFMILPKCEKHTIKSTLKHEQQKILTNYLCENVSPLKAGIMLSIALGLRIGELCALKWSDIDFEKSIITVNKTMQRIKNIDGRTATKIIITSPKSKSSVREIPIPDFLLQILRMVSSDPNDFVITGKKNYVEPRTMQYRFKSILKKLDLPQINFHALRHIFATKCIALGFDVKTLSEILGHSSVEITLNRYVHSSMERKISCMKLMSESLQRI